jgi:hypothetical protein
LGDDRRTRGYATRAQYLGTRRECLLRPSEWMATTRPLISGNRANTT